MAFLLGSLTGGLFSGMRDSMELANAWEDFKTKKAFGEAGAKARQALETDQAASKATAQPVGGDTTAAPKPAKYVEPDLESMPPPTFMSDKVTRTALKPAAATTLKEPPNYLGDRSKDTSPAHPDVTGDIAEPGQMPADGSGLGGIGGALNAAGAAMRQYSASRVAPPQPQQPPQQPATYLPGAPNLPYGATTVIPPNPAAAIAPGAQSVLPGTLNLAQQQTPQPFGARVLAALNPAGGNA